MQQSYLSRSPITFGVVHHHKINATGAEFSFRIAAVPGEAGKFVLFQDAHQGSRCVENPALIESAGQGFGRMIADNHRIS